MKTKNLFWKIVPTWRVFLLSILTFSSYAQNSQVNWSAFSNGFGISNPANSGTITAAGQYFTGISSNENSKVISGFLAYTSLIVTDVDDEHEIIPTVYKLNQNYPNPFNQVCLPVRQVQDEKRCSICYSICFISGRKTSFLSAHLSPDKKPDSFLIIN